MRRPAINPREILLENILIATDSLTYSKDVAAEIVGGRGRLERLISEGKIYAEKRKNVQNAKWHCNASQVLRYCKNYREL